MIHGSFEVTAELAARVAQVWSAYADAERRAQWYPIPSLAHSLDFREGGEELITGTLNGADGVERIEVRATFIDVQPERCITLTNDVVINEIRRWVSLVTVAFKPTTGGTQLTHHEAYTFLRWTGDGAHDVAHLRGSTSLRLNGLAALVEA